MYAIRSYYVVTVDDVKAVVRKELVHIVKVAVAAVDELVVIPVITSYSIHYTKLYESWQNQFCTSTDRPFVLIYFDDNYYWAVFWKP